MRCSLLKPFFNDDRIESIYTIEIAAFQVIALKISNFSTDERQNQK